MINLLEFNFQHTVDYTVPSRSYTAVKKLKLIRKLKMLHVGNAQNETITVNNTNLVFVGETL